MFNAFLDVWCEPGPVTGKAFASSSAAVGRERCSGEPLSTAPVGASASFSSTHLKTLVFLNRCTSNLWCRFGRNVLCNMRMQCRNLSIQARSHCINKHFCCCITADHCKLTLKQLYWTCYIHFFRLFGLHALQYFAFLPHRLSNSLLLI